MRQSVQFGKGGLCRSDERRQRLAREIGKRFTVS